VKIIHEPEEPFLREYWNETSSQEAHSQLKGKDVYWISPDKNGSFAIWLKKSREKLGLSQKQIAKKLKIAYQAYQKFENPIKSNPTLKTIIRLEKVFHEDLIQV